MLATSAHCPIVVVPPGAQHHLEVADATEASVACGVDGSEQAVAATRLAGDLASRMGLRLLVVHAFPTVESVVSYSGARATAPSLSAPPDARARHAERIVDDAVSAVDGRAAGIVQPGRPWDVLESVADREAGRLLVVATRGLSGSRSAVFGSVAAKVATSSRRPVVVLPEPAEAREGEPNPF
jgi:nucleotide-binding universal stress UspA family protein